jgi:hypothetical protein
MGFIKTNKAHNWFGKKYEKEVFLDQPWSAGGRFISLKITIREDRQAIQIIAIDNSLAEIPLYEGYCKSVEYLRLLLQNLFGGDGHDEEWINNQFNGKLY